LFGGRLTIWAARPSDAASPGPGKIGGGADRPLIGCGDGRALEILAVAVDGEDVPVDLWWRRARGA
jgi:hypothetical protein